MITVKKMMFVTVILIGFTCVSGQIPANDLFLMDLYTTGDSIFVTNPKNITNRPGYDSQPAFLLDDSGILYSSIREDGQADIYKYDLTENKISRITYTDNGHEYSPQPMSADYFSSVRIEEDSVTQRLWKFSRDGKVKSVILNDIFRVGYHGWLDSLTVGLFVLGEKEGDPFTFQIADIGSGQSKIICENPGRSIHKVPGEAALSFIYKESETDWWIRKIDPQTDQITSIVRTLPGSEDFCWIKSTKTLLMASRNVLFKYTPGQDSEWQALNEFEHKDIRNINRIAVSHNDDRLVIVSSR